VIGEKRTLTPAIVNLLEQKRRQFDLKRGTRLLQGWLMRKRLPACLSSVLLSNIFEPEKRENPTRNTNFAEEIDRRRKGR